MIIIMGNCIGETFPVRHANTGIFSHFHYVISRLDEQRLALLDGVAPDMEAAKDAVRNALQRLSAEDAGNRASRMSGAA